MNAPFRILFLCTGNSARSILAEYLIRKMAPGRFRSFSAGSNPTGRINPIVLRVLKEHFQIDTVDARSKSWEEFREVRLDFVVTVCDQARESCPVWPGQPVLAHWGSPDPAAFAGPEEEKVRRTLQVALQIRRRLELLCALPLEKMETIKLKQALDELGVQD